MTEYSLTISYAMTCTAVAYLAVWLYVSILRCPGVAMRTCFTPGAALHQPRIKGVFHVLGSRGPLQIVDAISEFVPITMINLVIRRWPWRHKGISHEQMHAVMLSFMRSHKSNAMIREPSAQSSQASLQDSAPSPSFSLEKGANSTFRANFIKFFPVPYRLPLFHVGDSNRLGD